MRVLLIEDEVRLAETIKRGLSDQGFVVDIADNGQDGLWSATEHDFDVIVLDIMLPMLNGYKVLEQLRARKIWTPVLMLTAKDGDYDIADALDMGADDYLTKPFNFVVLVARVRALHRRGARTQSSILTAGDLTVDPSRRRCERAGQEIALTAREFGVLEYLMRRRDEVVSKTEIVSGVWDENFDGDLNIVEVYIGYLRRKIDLPFGSHTIRTVRGAGYQLHGDGG